MFQEAKLFAGSSSSALRRLAAPSSSDPVRRKAMPRLVWNSEDAGASEVIIAHSIEEVRDLLAGDIRFDMGVVDLKLGEQDARPLVRELRDRNIPLIVATGFDPGLELEDAILISKPYGDETILAAIKLLLSRLKE